MTHNLFLVTETFRAALEYKWDDDSTTIIISVNNTHIYTTF